MDLRTAVALIITSEPLRCRKFYLRAVLLQENLLGANQPAVGLLFTRLSVSYDGQNNFAAAAEPLIKRSDTIFKRDKEVNKQILAICFSTLAFSSDGLGCKQDAVKARNEASNLLFKK